MFENDGLQSQLDQANELIKTAAASDAWNQLHESRKEIKALQAIVQASSHEIEGLQVGSLGSLNSMAVIVSNSKYKNRKNSRHCAAITLSNTINYLRRKLVLRKTCQLHRKSLRS